jgi:hypothetical protein
VDFYNFPVTRGGSLSLPSALHERSIVTHRSDFIPPRQKSPQKVKVLVGCILKNTSVSAALYISQGLQFLAIVNNFSSLLVSGSTLLLSPDKEFCR